MDRRIDHAAPRARATGMAARSAPLRYTLVGLLGAMTGYAGNRRFTFPRRTTHGQALPRFGLVAAAVALANAAIVWTGTEPFGLHYLPSQLAATALTLAAGYTLHRAWSFA